MNSRIVNYILVYLCFTAGLLLVFSPAYLNKFAQHDNFYHYRETDNPEAKNNCLHAAQFLQIHSLGRPIAAQFECEVYKYIYTSTDHQKLRLLIIGLLGVVGVLMFILFRRYGISDELAFTIPLLFLMFPGSQHAVMMTSINNVIAYGVSVLGVIALPLGLRGFGWKVCVRISLFLLSLLYCAYSYQSTVFFPFALVFLLFLFSPQRLPFIRTLALTLGPFLIVGLFYRNFSLLFIVPQASHLADQMFKMPPISEIPARLKHFHFDQLVYSFNFWFTTSDTDIAWRIYQITLVSLGAVLLFFKAERAKILKSLPFFYFNTGSVVLAPGWTPRVLQPLMMTTIGIMIYALFTLTGKLKSDQAIRLKRFACFSIAFLGAYLANANILTNATNQVVEGSFFRTALASHGRKITHIHVVIPKPGDSFSRDMYGLKRIGDADHMFNIEQHQNTYHILHYHLEEMFPFKYAPVECLFLTRPNCQADPRYAKAKENPRVVWITQSYIGDDFCVYPDTLVVNTFDYLVSWNATQYVHREIHDPPFDEHLLQLSQKNRKDCSSESKTH